MFSEPAWLLDLRGKGLRKGEDIRYKRRSEPLRGSEGHMPSYTEALELAGSETNAVTLGLFPIGCNCCIFRQWIFLYIH